MAYIIVPDEKRRLDHPKEISAFLAPFGIYHERWPLEDRVSPDAAPEEILAAYAPEIDRLRNTIQQVVLGKLEVEKLLRNRPQPPKHRKRTVETNVHFDSEACDTATLIEIIAEDRPGLLYDLSKTLSSAACNIDVVLIDTEGRKAIDVFYVASEGKKLTPAHQSTLEKSLLAACL